ncbi:MAG: hypothetical protein R3B95_04895 [Nitrospirales bacterium]|nr:hypothetical protein [Nitrospirales bacterium]
MRNIYALGLVGFLVLFGGCASHHALQDEQVDLYLSTLDDKHFVWCELDQEQCRRDFEQWKLTHEGRKIIEEFEREDTGSTDNTQHLPNVFRTRFMEEGQLVEEMVGVHDRGRPSVGIPKVLAGPGLPIKMDRPHKKAWAWLQEFMVPNSLTDSLNFWLVPQLHTFFLTLQIYTHHSVQIHPLATP